MTKIWVCAFLIMAIVAMVAGINSCFKIPQVYWSYSRDECVKVLVDGRNCGCDELPAKYTRVWVK